MGSSWNPTGAEAEAESEQKPEPDRRGRQAERGRSGEKVYANEDVDETFESELSTQDWREVGVACECGG